MTDIKMLLGKLNDEQIKPVLDTDGPVLVIAGAGSGKTRVLTTRIAYLVLEKNIRPSEIMAITFTNKAAGEMKERLMRIVGDIRDMWVSTIHSMCVRILRRDIDKLGFDSNFTIYDETDKDKVLKRIFEANNFDTEKFLKPVKSVISNAKNDCLSPTEFKAENNGLRFTDEFFTIYREYDNELMRSNALDFDDLLYKTYVLLSTHPEVAEYYSEKFRYIHIDEFQDTNKVQFAIARLLSRHHGNIFVVGDDDQSIYGWRGAKIENILSFDDIFKGAKVYKLERNYRSTKKILELANHIIAHNTERRNKVLWTENGEGGRVETYVGNDENDEATYTALQIKSLMARNKDLNFRDFAVFMRLNALSRAYEQEFMKYAIPCKVYGGFRFYERKEIKDIMAYLRLVANPSDNESFLRAIGCPRRGIGDKTLRELREFCSSYSLSLFQGVFRLEQSEIAKSAKTKLFNFGMMIESFKTFSDNHKTSELIENIIDVTSFNEQFIEKTEENTSKLYNISELKNSAEQFEKDNPGTNLNDYLNSVTLSSDTDDLNSDDAVTIATIHASKGLEYKCVFVAGLDEKILPVMRSIEDESEMEEERRLMYVAITRAKERLYLTRAKSRYMYGHRDYMTQSRFLKEAQPVLYPDLKFNEPQNNYQDNNYNHSGNAYSGGYQSRNNYSDYDDNSVFSGGHSSSGYNSNYAKRMLDSVKPKENKMVSSGEYKTGVKVRHQKFGEGVVIDVRGQGDNVLVDVAFKGVGIKKLSAKYAPMEIL